MKKFENLGRSLSKNEQKLVVGGRYDDSGCTTTYTGCNNSPSMGRTCDYHIACANESRDMCEVTCSPGDGASCT